MTTTKNSMMSINFIIESIDLTGEVSLEKAFGERKIENGKIHYIYNSEMGKCEFLITQEELYMKRNGEADIELIFNNSSGIGTMDYSTMNFNRRFLIKNGKTEIYSGLIVFSYDIFDEEGLINSLTIKISEEQ